MYIKYDKRVTIPYFGVTRFQKEHPNLKLTSKDSAVRATFEGKWQGRSAFVTLDGATVFIKYHTTEPQNEQPKPRRKRRSKMVSEEKHSDKDHATPETGPEHPAS